MCKLPISSKCSVLPEAGSKKQNMKKIALIFVGMIVVLIAFRSRSGYNSFIKPDREVKPEWNQSTVQHQRRSDLISNSADTVKGAAPFEQTTFTQVIKTRYDAVQTDAEHTKMMAKNSSNHTSQFWTTSSTNLISISFCLNGQVLMLN
ncbi:LemA family protein [Pedobacter duraquae]|uniref:LemA family protein n=2 Tax=Pedobacter duraquae TaxID=425511 RepID=A0A4R6ICZ0_9SPHI|nr:LemA family protein [Pedobacter duraquae]